MGFSLCRKDFDGYGQIPWRTRRPPSTTDSYRMRTDPLARQGNPFHLLASDTDPPELSGGTRHRFVVRAARLEISDKILVSQGQADVVEALEQPPAGVVVDLEGGHDLSGVDRPGDEVDRDLGTGVVLEVLPDQLDVVLRDDRGEQSLLAAVSAEDVGEARADDDPEAPVHQGPHGVLSTRARAEVRAGDEDRAVGIHRVVEDEGLVLAPGGEEAVLEAGARHALEVLRRDDLVGVDVAAAQRDADTGVGLELLHGSGLSGRHGRQLARRLGSVVEVGGARQRAADRGGGCDERADEVGAAALALATLEVAVGRRRAALPRGEGVGVHAEAHRAAGKAPLGAGLR